MDNRRKYKEIITASTKLGLTSFGGPAAHLGYFREEYVKKRKWLDDQVYADLVALCQFLPGPASSQVGIAIGLLRGGLLGGILSWIGFTLPSVLLLMGFAWLITSTGSFDSGWIAGLKIVAVAVVAHALLGMGKSLTPDRPRITIAFIAAALTLLIPTAIGQISIIVGAGVVGYIMYKNERTPDSIHIPLYIGKRIGIAAWILFFILLVLLPLIRPIVNSSLFSVFDIFYRVGSIVFGGGHVVLPMLEREVVPDGLSAETFIAGYGAAQAVPGPLFTLASYLGQIMGGVPGAVVATIAMFLPSFLLVIGTLPFWSMIRTKPAVQASLKGVNASVVGILMAALYDSVFVSAIHDQFDFIIALFAFGLLSYYKLAPWIVVVVTAVLGAAVHYWM